MNLLDFLHPHPPVIPPGLSAEHDLSLHALKTAEQYAEAGVKEEGGNNRGDQVEFMQHMAGANAGDAWCAAFVYVCIAKAWMWKQSLISPAKSSHENRLIMLANADEFSRATGFPRTAYCPTLYQTYHHKGQTITGKDVKKVSPQPGWIVLYDFLEQGEPHHVGIIVGTAGSSGEIITAEGNTSSGNGGSQADGGGVYVRIRDRSHVLAFIRWK